MRPASARTELIPIDIDRSSGVPLFRQVYAQIRDAVATGKLKPGDKLPSTRALSARLKVARAVVVTAFEQLLAESVIGGRVGAGTFVSEHLPHDLSHRAAEKSSRPATFQVPAGLRDGFLEHASAQDDRPFATGRTRFDPRTTTVWRRLSTRAARDIGRSDLGYADPRGSEALRGVVCRYLQTARGVRAENDQIVITTGTQQAVDLAIRVLLKPGDTAWVEDPGYILTAQALKAAGIALCPVPVDGDGLHVGQGLKSAPKARAAFITPSNQFPTGAVMSMARRLELLTWAKARQSWIIEDDYASEYRYGGKPLASLQGLDDVGRVIYVGTLNKVLFPGLRMGYLVAPRDLVAAFVGMRYLMDRQPASLTQAMVTAFMTEGHFAAHLRRMRAAYAEQRDTLTAELTKHGSDLFDIVAPDQGLHLVAYLKKHRSDLRLESQLRPKGVVVRAMSRLYLNAKPRQALMLGFSGFSPEQIRPAAKELVLAARATL